MARYRIVRDLYAGYECQKKVWWWPWWYQGKTNTFSSIRSAEDYIERWKKGAPNVIKEV